MNYNKIRPAKILKTLLRKITLPKYVLTNATYDHANLIVNKMGIDDEFEKIYSRDNIPEMKPNPHCYESVYQDISIQLGSTLEIIFFDDLLENLEYAKKRGWNTVWISSKYMKSYKYPYVDKAFSTLHDALDTLNF